MCSSKLRSTVSPGRTLAFALALVGAPRCVGQDAGIEVAVAFRPAPAPTAIETDDGRLLRVLRAELAIGGVELVPCDERAWLTLGTSPALAHGGLAGSGRLLLDLVGDGGAAHTLPVVPQPPGRYCAVRVHLEPPRDGDPTFRLEATEDGAPAVSIADPSVADALLPLSAPLVLDEPGLVGVEVGFDPWAWPLIDLDVEALSRRLESDARVTVCTSGSLC